MNTQKILYTLLCIGFYCTASFALTQPKFKLDLLKRAPESIPVNEILSAEYLVTNQTKITRRLVMKPIQGISQNLTFFQACSNPFTLAPGGSCRLVLNLNGALTPSVVNGGPVICKTKSASDNTPDPFLCSQPKQSDILSFVSTGKVGNASISVTPASLELTADSGTTQAFTVHNTSSTVTARNIQGTLPAGWNDVTQDASACTAVPPLSSCALKFTPGNTIHPVEEIPIKSTTSNTVLVSLAVLGNISVSPTTLSLEANGAAGALTITNETQSAITNVVATKPDGWGDVTVNNADCANLPANDTCEITFTPGASQHAAATIPIQGDDTITISATVSVEADGEAIISVLGPNPLALATGPTPTRTMTIQNNSATAPALGVAPVFAGTPLDGQVLVSEACTDPLPPGDQCDIEFTAAAGQVAQTGFHIQGTNTNSFLAFMAVNLEIGSAFNGGYVFQLNNDGVSGKVASPSNASSGGTPVQWGGVGTVIGTDVNNGQANTNNIISVLGLSGNNAAGLCRLISVNMNPNTFSCNPTPQNPCVGDFYLPAICELNQQGGGVTLCTAPAGIIPNIGSIYEQNAFWSSSEYASNPSIQSWLGNNKQFLNENSVSSKNQTWPVICAKVF